ncbi:MAG: phosphorylase [Pedosphaera sp.]|nr:phosphorylase [Pedosphaera sp.]
MDSSSAALICFAVKEEAKFFVPSLVPSVGSALITGMGRKNAAEGIRKALAKSRPTMVITAGFAGGLNPKLAFGTVVFEADSETGLTDGLLKAGAVPVRFHCADRVAVTVAEKQSLWQSTQADVVEMESSVIRSICREHAIPSATVRVISDAANEDLPLDFNTLMTPDDRINYAKLAWTVAVGPQKIPALIRFQKLTMIAARKLAEALHLSLGSRRD